MCDAAGGQGPRHALSKQDLSCGGHLAPEQRAPCLPLACCRAGGLGTWRAQHSWPAGQLLAPWRCGVRPGHSLLRPAQAHAEWAHVSHSLCQVSSSETELRGARHMKL